MSESVSDEEKAGLPLPPLVALTPRSPPLTISEMYPSPPAPPPPPFDRAAALAGLQAAFALLADEELQVARMRMLGCSYLDITEELGVFECEAERLWKAARKKLGRAIFGGT